MNYLSASATGSKTESAAEFASAGGKLSAPSTKPGKRMLLKLRREVRARMAVVDQLTLSRHLAAQAPTIWLPSSPDELLFTGIDGGISGAMAALDRNNKWHVQRVVAGRYKARNALSIEGNLLLLHTLADMAGGIHRLVVVYESARKNTAWGTKNSFAGGSYDEFWRVLLTNHKFRFISVDPKTWQAHCFSGLHKAKPKQKALKFVQENYHDLEWLDAYPKTEQHGIVDAMCIALWARHQHEAGVKPLDL